MNISFVGAGNFATKLGNLLHEAGHQIAFGTCNPTDDQISIADAIQQSEIIILAIPYLYKNELLIKYKAYFENKIVVDATNPLHEDWSPFILDPLTSSGEQTQALLPDSKVVKAFNTVFADVMTKDKLVFDNVPLTTFIAGNDEQARQSVFLLTKDAGLAPVIVGDISTARYLEAMAHLNIAIALGQKGGTDAGFKYFQRKI